MMHMQLAPQSDVFWPMSYGNNNKNKQTKNTTATHSNGTELKTTELFSSF